jgi:hypothetical protein
MQVLDYSAELYVAGRFANAGWNVYFPHRDRGFDFVVSRSAENGMEIFRPVQVKGKYPTAEKGDKTVYGYVGELTQLHPEMVLAIPFFSAQSPDVPACVAYLPFSVVRTHSRGYRCEPATYRAGMPSPRRDYARFFDSTGLSLVERDDWQTLSVVGPGV